MILRACVKCGLPSPESYCPDCKPRPWATSTRKQRVTISGSAEQARRRRILKRDMGACHVCDQLGADQVDHVVPLAEGGADEDWNLASIHAEPCHAAKTRDEAARARERASGVGMTRDRDFAPGTAEVAERARQSLPQGGR